MDTGRIRRELGASVRLLWDGERWLWPGLAATVLAYGLWVGATGAALAYAAEFAGSPISVADPSGVTTVALAVAAVAWVAGPAVLAAYLLADRVTNLRDNVERHYRFHHPALLLAVPLAVYLIGGAVAVALGQAPRPLLAVLVLAGALLLVRTLAFSYRVFSLSSPLVVAAATAVSAAVVAVAVLVEAALLAGRRSVVEDAAAGVADLLGAGSPGFVTGSTTVGGVVVPTMLGLAAATPLVLSGGYVLAQSAAGLFVRLRAPEVRRAQLRTGQRYPEFARPAGAGASDGGSETGSPSAEESPSGDVPTTPEAATDAEESTADGESDEESVSHTKVFTPPDDGDGFGSVPGSDDDTVAASEAGDGRECPACGESYDADADVAYCPACGERL